MAIQYYIPLTKQLSAELRSGERSQFNGATYLRITSTQSVTGGGSFNACRWVRSAVLAHGVSNVHLKLPNATPELRKVIRDKVLADMTECKYSCNLSVTK